MLAYDEYESLFYLQVAKDAKARLAAAYKEAEVATPGWWADEVSKVIVNTLDTLALIDEAIGGRVSS